MQNANIFSKENVNIIVSAELARPVNEAEQEILGKLKDKSVIDFQATGRLLHIHNVLSDDKFSYKGINKEEQFVQKAIINVIDGEKAFSTYNNFNDIAALEADVLVSINQLQNEYRPEEFLRDALSIRAKEYYIIFPCAKLYGQELNSEPKFKRLISTDSFVVENRYTHDAVKELAAKFELNYKIFPSEGGIDDIALLYKNEEPVNKPEKVEVIEQEKELVEVPVSSNTEEVKTSVDNNQGNKENQRSTDNTENKEVEKSVKSQKVSLKNNK